MNILAKHASDLELKGDALKTAAEAKKAKQEDSSVINATIGTFYFEDGSFGTFRVVDELLKSLKDDQFYGYTASDGGKPFKKAIENWVFGVYKNDICSQLHTAVVATPGGTGAICSSLENSLDVGEYVLLPNVCWSPYLGMAKKMGLEVKRYELFFEDTFNLESIKNSIEEVINHQQKLVIILNDPCNNPTGYSLSYDEFNRFITLLNQYPFLPITIILDAAYLDFDNNRTLIREKLTLLTNAGMHIVTNICFSASKTFSCYGLRLGAQLIVSTNKEHTDNVYQAANFYARHTWSNSARPGIELLVRIDQSPELQLQYNNELNSMIELLKIRSTVFLKEASELGLKTHPYKSGFFINIPCSNPDLALDRLRDEQKIYVLPFEDSIRIAICAMTIKEITGLASRIIGILNTME